LYRQTLLNTECDRRSNSLTRCRSVVGASCR